MSREDFLDELEAERFMRPRPTRRVHMDADTRQLLVELVALVDLATRRRRRGPT